MVSINPVDSDPVLGINVVVKDEDGEVVDYLAEPRLSWCVKEEQEEVPCHLEEHEDPLPPPAVLPVPQPQFLVFSWEMQLPLHMRTSCARIQAENAFGIMASMRILGRPIECTPGKAKDV
ncbi:uncharacterized protein LOC112239224 isoform X2 [Oncorhynchus tshawytscha]|uniref:uncharacterized protein LOC112239224 isoform X2 n=1 Tax=Oncorhynchus tshawytscha TaxID=74940 RepID=UPI000D0A36ED|nr:uncharacterized protein LOC112239224 isoform X2 [Oncorhynchus tshawytscha]